jgi:hypothetical protein
MTKIITFGDIHGRTTWEKFADISILVETPNLKTDYDYYIFCGDYTDSHTEQSVVIKHNLFRLIQFKANYPDKVILLLGNHDMNYIQPMNEPKCTGFRPEAWYDLNDAFKAFDIGFQLAFQLGSIVWTHAGIHRGWYNVEFPFHSENIADDLNGAYKQGVQSIFDVGHRRGGFKNQGGPLWADKSETSHKPLRGISQVMGHTPVDGIKTYPVQKDKDHTLYYCDCLAHGKALELTIGDHMIAWKELQVDTTKYFTSFE